MCQRISRSIHGIDLLLTTDRKRLRLFQLLPPECCDKIVVEVSNDRLIKI